MPGSNIDALLQNENEHPEIHKGLALEDKSTNKPEDLPVTIPDTAITKTKTGPNTYQTLSNTVYDDYGELRERQVVTNDAQIILETLTINADNSNESVSEIQSVIEGTNEHILKNLNNSADNDNKDLSERQSLILGTKEDGLRNVNNSAIDDDEDLPDKQSLIDGTKEDAHQSSRKVKVKVTQEHALHAQTTHDDFSQVTAVDLIDNFIERCRTEPQQSQPPYNAIISSLQQQHNHANLEKIIQNSASQSEACSRFQDIIDDILQEHLNKSVEVSSAHLDKEYTDDIVATSIVKQLVKIYIEQAVRDVILDVKKTPPLKSDNKAADTEKTGRDKLLSDPAVLYTHSVSLLNDDSRYFDMMEKSTDYPNTPATRTTDTSLQLFNLNKKPIKKDADILLKKYNNNKNVQDCKRYIPAKFSPHKGQTTYVPIPSIYHLPTYTKHPLPGGEKGSLPSDKRAEIAFSFFARVPKPNFQYHEILTHSYSKLMKYYYDPR